MKEYRVNRADLSLYLIGAFAFVVLGALMVTGVIGPADETSDVDRIGGIVIGWLAIAFFGSMALLSLPSLLRGQEPVIRIDENGIFDRRVCSKPIPWAAVNKVRVFRGKTLYALPQRFISIDVDDPDEYALRNGNSRLAGALKKLNALYDEPGITISTATLGKSIDDVLDSIRRESNGAFEIER